MATVICPDHEVQAIWTGRWICPVDGAVIEVDAA